MTTKEILEQKNKHSDVQIFAVSCTLTSVRYLMRTLDKYKDNITDEEVIRHTEEICETVKDIWLDYDHIQMPRISDRVAEWYFNHGESIEDMYYDNIV